MTCDNCGELLLDREDQYYMLGVPIQLENVKLGDPAILCSDCHQMTADYEGQIKASYGNHPSYEESF